MLKALISAVVAAAAGFLVVFAVKRYVPGATKLLG
jgi:beta-lactamase regulating signal transducer with metallopeptidase domain